MRHKIPALVALGACIVLFAVTVALGVKTFGGGPEEDGGELAAPPVQATQEPAPAETTAVPWSGPLVPEQAVAAGPEYFADAAFLGNSVLSGLWYYDYEGLFPKEEDHWYWHDSLTIMEASPYAARMADKQFGKIYLEFGINELNYDMDTLRDAFDLVLNQLQNDHPEAIIYITSVTPVSKYCDENRNFKRNTVLALNEMLQQVARDHKVWYLDVYPVLCGEDGYLPSDVTPDGIHFTPAHYELWLVYMKTHYVPTGPVQTQEAPAAAGTVDETTPTV